jgi:hypothetical protein
MPDRGAIGSHFSLCDTIHQGTEGTGQTMEVVEHILHITTGAGFHHTWNTEWGLSETSEVWEALTEAKTNGIFVTTAYEEQKQKTNMKQPEFVRLLIQEYAFWIITVCRLLVLIHIHDSFIVTVIFFRSGALEFVGEIRHAESGERGMESK